MPGIRFLRDLDGDGRLLFGARALRMFAFGALSVVLALYLSSIGLNPGQIGLLLTLTLAGDAVVSLWVTGVADRVGRKKMLLLGAVLMVLAGVAFALTRNFLLLTVAGIIGTLSPSGNEVGPFLALEQSAMSERLPGATRTTVFGYYNLVGSLATALGALAGGLGAQTLQGAGMSPLESYRWVVVGYGALGFGLLGLFASVSGAVETRSAAPQPSRFGLHQSRGVILKLSSLFALDAFAGGLVVQSLIAFWFHRRYGVEPGALGGIFFGANLFAAFSALIAARLGQKFGLINTMVWTHIPSNVLLILVPLMPNLGLAIAVLLARFSISQMDVPTRQSYVMAVVQPDERSAAAGVTGIARTVGASLAPVLTGLMGISSVPFFLAGGLKIVYDLALYRSFVGIKPPEDGKQG